LLLPSANPTDKTQISKLHNSLYNKDFYTASKFDRKFFRFSKFFYIILWAGKTLVIFPAANVKGYEKEILRKRRERHSVGRKTDVLND